MIAWALELLARIAVATLLTAAIKGVVALTGHSIAWWAATLIAIVLAFGGWLIISGDWID